MKRLPELVLAASMVLFVVAGNRLVDQLPTWHEVVSALPNNPTQVLGERSCLDGARVVVSASRPHLALCLGSQMLPIMVTPYASGIVSWPFALFAPLHAGDTFVMRRIWLVIAALSLILTFRLVSRVQDRDTAALACLLTAASSPFLVINTLLLPFETLPCTLTVAALSAWVVVGDESPPLWRLYLGALLAGLAVAANIKALFLLVPAIAIALRAGVRPRAIGWKRGAVMAALFLLPLLPMAIFAVVDPQHGFSEQVGRRGGLLLKNLRLGRFVSEPLLLFNFVADVGSYTELAQGGRVRWGLAQLAVAPPILYCVVVGMARLAGRRWGSPLSAACGAIVLTYFLVSILLYGQYPGGNYAPLHDVFGLAMAAGVADVARRLAGTRWKPVALAAVLALAALGLTLTLRRDYGRRVTFSINSTALRAAAAHLRDAPEPKTVLSTTYNLAGVFDALGHGRVHALQVHDALARCDRPGSVDDCLVDVWKRLLVPERLPVRVIAPTSTAAVDKPVEVTRRVEETLEKAAAALGLESRLEGRFSTADGLPVLALYRISRR